MKVLIYFQDADTIKTSGIGRAMSHQLSACKYAGIETTTDKNDTYDLAHINTYLNKSHKALAIARKKGVPVIVHGHSTKEDFARSFKCWRLISPFYFHHLKYMYSRADLVITPTPHSKDLIEAYEVAKKVVAISNGIDIPSYAPNPEAVKAFHEKFGLKENEPFVMGVGFPFERKGLLDFFDVAKRFPNVKFFWFGYLQRILMNEKVARAIRHKPENVIMPGYCKGELIRGAYQSATCLFFPSYEENEGIVVLEALASRCPLVLRKIDTYRGWVEDGVNAHLCSNNEEYVACIEKLLKDGEDPKILDAGYKTAEERDLPLIGEQLKQAYESVLKKD